MPRGLRRFHQSPHSITFCCYRRQPNSSTPPFTTCSRFAGHEPSSAQVRWNETAGLAEQGKLSARTRYGAQETNLMKKSNRASASAQKALLTANAQKPLLSMSAGKPLLTVGIDLGDRCSRYCIVNEEGEVIEEGRIQTTAAALERHFGGRSQAADCPGMRNAFAVGELLVAGHGTRGMGGECAQATGDHRQRVEERSQRCGEAGAVCGLQSATVVADSASQSGTTTGPESAASARHPGAGAHHAGECAARVAQKRRPPVAQVFDGVVCPRGRQGDSSRLRGGGPAPDRTSGAAHATDPGNGQADRDAGQTLSGSGKAAQCARSGAGDCSGVRVDAGLAHGSREESGGGSLPGLTPAAIAIGRFRSPASYQQNRQ